MVWPVTLGEVGELESHLLFEVDWRGAIYLKWCFYFLSPLSNRSDNSGGATSAGVERKGQVCSGRQPVGPASNPLGYYRVFFKKGSLCSLGCPGISLRISEWP